MSRSRIAIPRLIIRLAVPLALTVAAVSCTTSRESDGTLIVINGSLRHQNVRSGGVVLGTVAPGASGSFTLQQGGWVIESSDGGGTRYDLVNVLAGQNSELRLVENDGAKLEVINFGAIDREIWADGVLLGGVDALGASTWDIRSGYHVIEVRDAFLTPFIREIQIAHGTTFIFEAPKIWVTAEDNPTGTQQPQPPVIFSGPWANPVPDGTVQFGVFVSDPDSPPEQLTYVWSSAGGPGQSSFSPNRSSTAVQTLASFSQPGVYLITVTVTDGDGGQAAADITVTVP
jgi:hypothetical protein